MNLFSILFMFCNVAIVLVLLQMTDNFQTMNKFYLRIDSDESREAIKEKIKNVTNSVTSIDDLYLSIRESDLDVVNDVIMNLYQQHKLHRHHIEFSDNLKVDLMYIPKYDSLLLMSGCSVTINESNDVVKLFSILHTLNNLRSVKVTCHFHTTENIDSFYETLHQFPTNAVQHISIDNFLPYAVMFKIIRAFIQQSPNLERITLYTPLTPNAFEHFQNQYVREIELLAQKPLTIYVRTRDKSVVEKRFGLVLLKSLNDAEERQFELEYPFFVKATL